MTWEHLARHPSGSPDERKRNAVKCRVESAQPGNKCGPSPPNHRPEDICDHLFVRAADEGFICLNCAEKRSHRPAPWEPGGGPPAVRGDLKPHFNFSAGQPIESRAHLAEVCKREGLRPVDPSLASEERAWGECDRLKKNNEKKIANPKTPLRRYYEEQIRNA